MSTSCGLLIVDCTRISSEICQNVGKGADNLHQHDRFLLDRRSIMLRLLGVLCLLGCASNRFTQKLGLSQSKWSSGRRVVASAASQPHVCWSSPESASGFAAS